jgi:hypothetical protein
MGTTANRRTRMTDRLQQYRDDVGGGYEYTPYAGGAQPWTDEERTLAKARRAERKFTPVGFGEAGPRRQRATWNTLAYEGAPIGGANALEQLKQLKQGVDDRVYMISTLVGGLDLDLKRNKSVRTLKSAQAWIDANPDRERLYYVQLEDFDGDGDPDDVVVRSKLNNRPVWVNTWSTTGGTRFTKKNLVRDQYYDKYPTHYERLDAPEKFMPFYHEKVDPYANAYTKFQQAIKTILKDVYGLTLRTDPETGKKERLGNLAKRRAPVVKALYRGWVNHLLHDKIIRASGLSSLRTALNGFAEQWDNNTTAEAQQFAYNFHQGGGEGSYEPDLIGGGGASGMDVEPENFQ